MSSESISPPGPHLYHLYPLLGVIVTVTGSVSMFLGFMRSKSSAGLSIVCDPLHAAFIVTWTVAALTTRLNTMPMKWASGWISPMPSCNHGISVLMIGIVTAPTYPTITPRHSSRDGCCRCSSTTILDPPSTFVPYLILMVRNKKFRNVLKRLESIC